MNRVYDRLTIQGEGPYSGARCTFVRLYGCNLHCSWCDSAETWDVRGRNGIPYPVVRNSTNVKAWEIVEAVRALDVDMVVITGGEPLIQRDMLADLAGLLHREGVAVHIETNGTLSPGDRLVSFVEHFVVSPKLPSADAGPKAINLPVLQGFAALGWRRASFKIVVTSTDDLIEAVELLDEIGAQRRARWVMPEGRSLPAVVDGLESIVDKALALGFNVSGREHVILWGDERGR